MKKIGKDKSLAKAYIKYSDDPANVGKTFNDFFKAVGVKKKHRSTFLVASILKQAQELANNEWYLKGTAYFFYNNNSNNNKITRETATIAVIQP
jgi:hypothetical protein